MSSSPQVASESVLKRLVSQAGGYWVGVQDLGSLAPSLLLFNSPTTGSTLAVKLIEQNFSEARLVAEMRQHIADSDALFAAAKRG